MVFCKESDREKIKRNKYSKTKSLRREPEAFFVSGFRVDIFLKIC